MSADTISQEMPRPRRWAWLGRLLRRFLRPSRKLTRAEQREIEAGKLERSHRQSHEAGLQMEAELAANRLTVKLSDRGVRYEYKKRDGSFHRYKVVRFLRPYVIREEAIYLKADLRPGHSPPGVGVKELGDPEILPDLEIAVGHPVKTHYSAETGFWYIVERELGKRGIPNHVKFDDVLASRPAELDGLALPLGMGADKRVAWRSLKRMYSLLIAGSTGSGKSNVINAMICALLKYNTPRQLRLVLVDLKGGVEFTFYQDVPHLLPVPIGDGQETAIIETREQVIPALEWLVKEGERRLALMKTKRAKNIGEYNQHWGPLPHVVLIIDEWADVKVEPKIGTRAEELLVNVSNRLRAAGIHVIVCTQSPTKEVISLRIKNALPAKLCFSCASPYASMLVIGNHRAQGMEPEGRAIFDWNQAQFELQAPFINNETVDEMVAQAIRGEFSDAPPRKHDVTDLEIFERVIDPTRGNGGYLTVQWVFDNFRGRGLVRDDAVKFCQRAEGQTVVLSSTPYQVLPPTKMNEGRRLLPVEQIEELAQAAAQANEPPREAVTEQELVEWALAENGGRLQVNAVWETFRPRGLSQHAAGELGKRLEGKVYTIAGRAYRVLPSVRTPGGGAKPRRLEALEPTPPDAAPGESVQPAPLAVDVPTVASAALAGSEPANSGESAATRQGDDAFRVPPTVRLDKTIAGELEQLA